ncbi:MAG: AtpZ/AtpI family protein [Patescibacteria group bacterium]|jgi:F0F1-type ATP synthase assembly protein I
MTQQQLGKNAVSFALEFGITLAVVLFVFIWLGRKADIAFNTAPWLSLVGLGIGLLLGAVWTYRKIKSLKP